MNNPNCGACGMLNSRGFCSLTACRFPIINGLGTWQERILANKPKPSNADRIRSMTDEELADYLEEVQLKTVKAYGNDDLLLAGELRKYWLDWLKQEVTDG